MTKVFVHGNPETQEVWDPLVEALAAHGVTDIVRLSPPGFGAPVPDGFGGTRAEHTDWLIGQIEEIGAPVNLLGHDWGAGHTYGVAAARPDLLKSWAADCAGLMHPDYEWHPAAQAWQTPGDGEASIKQIIAMEAEDLVSGFGVPPELAPTMAQNLDARMGQAILNIYRSAKQPELRDLGDRLAAAERRPSLLIHATNDPYVPPDMVFDVSDRTGSEILTLEGLEHWWMWQNPQAAARGLADFWART
ncbi:alpha/beta hydrolase [Thioclava sp. BHET1]|nr:alpha/beta hydrolase [Thioclava sp. BHET1]